MVYVEYLGNASNTCSITVAALCSAHANVT